MEKIFSHFYKATNGSLSGMRALHAIKKDHECNQELMLIPDIDRLAPTIPTDWSTASDHLVHFGDISEFLNPQYKNAKKTWKQISKCMLAYNPCTHRLHAPSGLAGETVSVERHLTTNSEHKDVPNMCQTMH